MSFCPYIESALARHKNLGKIKHMHSTDQTQVASINNWVSNPFDVKLFKLV
jgi:hypothetical protein